MGNNLVPFLNSDLINGIANGLQLVDVTLNVSQVSNDEIMKALEIQNKKYLELIVNQDNLIIEQNELLISQNKELLDKYDKILSLFGGIGGKL